MSEVKLCRICVRKDVKMYEHDRFQLMFYYKEITGSKISSRDCLPKWFCFECAALLHKYHEFKKKCRNGQKVFKNLLETEHVSLQDITRRKKIISSEPHLQILSVSQKVKTYSVKHSKIKSSNKNNYNTFTEIYLDDVKSDDETQNLKIKEKEVVTTAVEIEQTPNDDNFHNDFDDSNDSTPLVITEDYVKDETSNGGTGLNIDTSCTKTDLIKTRYDTQTSQDTQKTSHNTQNPSHDTQITSYDTRSTVTKPTHQNESEMNVTNLDNKFQRSVKKKFLDENHWTKITLSDEEATRRFQAKALEHKYLTADYKCLDCYRTFSQEDMMKRHVKLRHCESLGPNECRHCRMRFKWKSRLQKHLKEHYTIYKCLRCELSFPVEISAFQHDYSHNGVTWTCAHCGQGFRHSSTYYTHLRKHKSKYVCTLCGVSFVSEFGLFMHKRVKHVINEDSKEEVSNTYCKVCEIKFDTLKGYEDHFAESALHATEVTEGTTCLPLKTKCSKKRVPRISTNCTSCGKTFSTYAAFSKHHLLAHPTLSLPRPRPDRPDGQRQVCEVCGLTLASAWSLANHLNTHSRDKRYTCNTCGMQLSSSSVLQRHQLTHSHERNFVCDVCQKRFTHRSGLRLHLKTHEKEPSPTRSRKKKGESQHVMEYFKSYGNLANTYR